MPFSKPGATDWHSLLLSAQRLALQPRRAQRGVGCKRRLACADADKSPDLFNGNLTIFFYPEIDKIRSRFEPGDFLRKRTITGIIWQSNCEHNVLISLSILNNIENSLFEPMSCLADGFVLSVPFG
jgi:hypothetical protein